MPPKKSATNSEAGEASSKFTWEGANDMKLLTLTQGRYVKPDEFETLSTAFPGTTPGSIRNRISALRVKQRNLYEELEWTMPEGGAGHSAKKRKRELDSGVSTPTNRNKKRKNMTAKVKMEVGRDGEVTPVKRKGGKKRGKVEWSEDEDEDEDEEEEEVMGMEEEVVVNEGIKLEE